MLNCKSPRLHGFVRIGGTDHRKPRKCAQARELLNRLVSGAILPKSDAVVRKHVDRLEIAQSPQPDSRLHVVRKREKRRAEGKHTAMRGHSIYRGTHGVLANPESDVPPGIAPLPADRTQRP